MRTAACLAVIVTILGCQKREQERASAASSAVCASDADCVFACAAKGECCDRPRCELVQHQQVAAEIVAYNLASCTDAQRAKCPENAAQPDPDYVIAARCKAGQCVAEKLPKTSAEWQNPLETLSAAGYDRSCQTVEDCRLVDELPCNHFNCGSVAIAVKELERWNQAAAAIRCGPQPKLGSTSCRGFDVACERGTCVAQPRR